MYEAVPFKTDDAILAQCLVNAGVPEWQTPTNCYDEAILRGLGFRGLTLDEAAKAAWQQKKRGHVDYYFERTPELDHFIKSYREQVAEIESKDADKDAGAALRAIIARATAPENPMDEREALLRITCINLKLRVAFVNRWKELTPFLRIQEAGSAQETGENTTRHPGFKLIPLTLSAERKAKIGL